MMRGTFANIRIRNEMAPGTEGGFTKLYPEEKVLPVYDAVVEYKKRGTDLVVIGGCHITSAPVGRPASIAP